MNNTINLYYPLKRLNIPKEVLHHMLFWMLYFTFNVLRWGSYFDDYLYSFHSNLVEFLVHIILVYFNLYFLWPKLIPNNYGLYIITLLVATLLMTFVRIVLTYEYVSTDIFKEADRPGAWIFDINYVVAGFIGQLYVIGFTTAIKITIDYIKNLRVTKELEKQSLENELSMLKSQLQPHFFFNTLNNLYALTLQKSNEAPETVVKLSEFMSYVIYQGNKKKVPLMDEIKYIQNYIDLEKLRFGERVQVNLSLSGTVENHKIPPLLLLPFIENSFKHGTYFELNEVSLDIDIKVKEKTLIFRTFNKKNNDATTNEKHQQNKGIGLRNTKRRLGLLYGDNYKLTIQDNQNDFEVILKIPLK